MNIAIMALLALVHAGSPLTALEAEQFQRVEEADSTYARLSQAVESRLAQYANDSEEVLQNFERLVSDMECESFPGERVLDAVAFAARCHQGQLRKGQEIPYIIHPLHVTCLLWEEGGVRDEEILIAGILHDTVEDTSATIEDVRERFGQCVATYVLEVTLPSKELMDRASRYRWQVASAPYMSEGGRLIKLADCCSNLSSPLIHEWGVEQNTLYLERTQRLLRAMHGTHHELEALLSLCIEGRRDQIAALTGV